MKTSVQLQSTNAQTASKTEEYQRPESKTIQQLAVPDEVCKTSTPGSNPGGASKFISNFVIFQLAVAGPAATATRSATFSTYALSSAKLVHALTSYIVERVQRVACGSRP